MSEQRGIISEYRSQGDLVVEWRISNFFSLSEEDGASYCSPDFSFGGERWWLGILPNGWSGRDSSGHVDLGLWKWSSARSIRKSFSLSLKTAKGEKYHEEHYRRDFKIWSPYHTCDRFIPRSELTMKSSELVPEGVLTVVCTMKSSPSAGSESSPKWYWPFSKRNSKETATVTKAALAGTAVSAERCSARSDLAPTPSGPEPERASASSECYHCKRTFDAESLPSHQKKCMHRPIKCPDCLKVVVLQKWLDEHECQKMRPKGESLEGGSKNTCVEAWIQIEEENRESIEGNTKNTCVEACTQTEEENGYNCREKLLMSLCIASILIAVITGCALAYSKTPLSSSHPCGETVAKIQTSEINKPINESEFDGSSSDETGAADIKQSEGVNKTAELILTAELNAELNKANQSEIAGSDIPEVSVDNQTDTAETNEAEAAAKIETSEIKNKVNNRSDVGSNQFEALGSNETGATDIKDYEGVNKTLAAEFNKTDQSETAGSDIPEVSAANQADTAETDESETLPQPILMVTEVGSTYLELVLVLPEESKSNAAHIHYVVHFRIYGAQWQEVSFPDASRTSYSLTNLDPGMFYQIYVIAVDSSRFSRPSETATVRTSNKVIDHNSSKDHGKQLVLYAASITILVIAIACVYVYFKTLLSDLHGYGEGTQIITAEEDNIIKADPSEVAEVVEPEASDSKTRAAIETEGPVSFKNLPEDYGFVADINHLLKENKGIDVTFDLETPSGKKEFSAHQLILAVMSSYFADKFYDKGRNKGHQVIPLKGINPKAFEQMIRYCYGEKPIFKTTEEVCVLFKIASEFKVISLQNLCCSFFKHTKIKPGNLFSVLEISEEMKDKSLTDKCRKILQDKSREIMTSYELCDVTPAMVHIILDLPRLSLASEYELIKWIFDWAKARFEDKDSSCSSPRDYLSELLRNMNFLALTVEEFAILSRENPKVFNSDERASISLNIACPGSWKLPVWYNKDLKGRVYTGSNE